MADQVFTGTAVRMDDPSKAVFHSTGDPLYWTFAVDDVEQGDLPDRATVASAIEESSCGYTFELGKRYRVYATDSNWNGHIATGLGSGNELLPSLDDPPRVEGEFHTLEYHLLQLGFVAVPAVPIVGFIGLGWWMVRRSRR